MKRFLPYILIFLLVAAVVFLFSRASSAATGKKTMNYRLTLKKRDKLPYGTYVAYESLSRMFPKASILTERREPGNWDSLSMYQNNQALIIVSHAFDASEDEMEKLVRFVENGNDVFISTFRPSYYAEKFIKCDMFFAAGITPSIAQVYQEPDSMSLSLTFPGGTSPKQFTYPGHDLGSWFYEYDTNTSDVLGFHQEGKPDFIHLKRGNGNLYLHLTPMAFTNYFLLYKNNIEYYERIMSFISPAMKRVAWDEYFVNGAVSNKKRNNSWLSVLMGLENSDGKKSFRVAILLLLGLLAVYVLMEMRRKQRLIPPMSAPRNDSLDFVKTIGRLYHDKGDHHNLARKMASYFLEHVRNRYKMTTSQLDDQFEQTLGFKTGVDKEEINSIVSFIRHLDQSVRITDGQLAEFHKNLESFYSKA